MKVNVDELYYKKVKNIYGQILKYASTAQKTMTLTESENQKLTEIKLANRKMVESIKDIKEINKNLSLALQMDNKYLSTEYDHFREKLTKVLRVIYKFRTENH